jgi:hypothetical protein
MMFRSEAQKKDQASSWQRRDRAFFASGACHILAHVFLQEYADHKYRPYMILPNCAFRGSHVYAATEDSVFDYHGFSDKGRFLKHYFFQMKRFFPGWTATIIELNDFMTPSFFGEFKCRAPNQYFADPLPRARAFIQRKGLLPAHVVCPRGKSGSNHFIAV